MEKKEAERERLTEREWETPREAPRERQREREPVRAPLRSRSIMLQLLLLVFSSRGLCMFNAVAFTETWGC